MRDPHYYAVSGVEPSASPRKRPRVASRRCPDPLQTTWLQFYTRIAVVGGVSLACSAPICRPDRPKNISTFIIILTIIVFVVMDIIIIQRVHCLKVCGDAPKKQLP